jgi:DNA-binding transcriptional ArsR family regulator
VRKVRKSSPTDLADFIDGARNRKKIAAELFAAPRTPSDLSRRLGIPPPSVSRTLRELSEAGVARKEGEPKARGRFVLTLTAAEALNPPTGLGKVGALTPTGPAAESDFKARTGVNPDSPCPACGHRFALREAVLDQSLQPHLLCKACLTDRNSFGDCYATSRSDYIRA